MENQASSKSIIINYGLMLGAASILISLVKYAMGMHLDQGWAFTTLSLLLTIGLIVFAIKKFKETNDGFLSWGQAVKIGVGVAIISALISAIYQFIFISFIEPDFMQQVLEKQNQTYMDQGYTEEQIEQTNALSKSLMNPTMMAAIGILSSAIGGFIISAIAGAIMKKSEEDQY